jgi:hypothetical protein
MKRAILLGLLAASTAANTAFAIGRYDARTYTCSQAQALIDREEAVIFRYPASRAQNMTLYDRYVSDGGFCDRGYYASRAYIPTRDSPSCPVYMCRSTTDFCDRP